MLIFELHKHLLRLTIHYCPRVGGGAAFLAIALFVGIPIQLHAQLECLPTSTVACSSDWLNVAPPIAAYSQMFSDACLRHDYCYRFGAATYGYTKAKCDNDFYNEMKDICDPAWYEVVFTAGLSTIGCRVAAKGYYEAVQNFGSSAFKNKDEGAVCYYESSIGSKQPPFDPNASYWILFY